MDWDNFSTFKFIRKNAKGDRSSIIIARVSLVGGLGGPP